VSTPQGDRDSNSANQILKGARAGLKARFAGIGRSEAWGYVVWGAAGLVIAIPEITAAVNAKAPWPTISGMVGHLEFRWSWVALIVVALIVSVAFHAARFPWRQRGQLAIQATERVLGRTVGGRFTMKPEPAEEGEKDQVAALWLLIALAVVIAGSVLVAALGLHDKFILGYVLYGLIALFWVVVPSGLAFWFARDVPFPTLFRTIGDLERRLHFATVLILAGLVILLIHLALYPWPAIFHQLQPPTVHSP